MTDFQPVFRAIAILALAGIVFAGGCQRPEQAEKPPAVEAPAEGAARPQTRVRPAPEPAPPEPTAPEPPPAVKPAEAPADPGAAPAEIEAGPEAAPPASARPAIVARTVAVQSKKKEKKEPNLRRKLHSMRRSVDRRLMWARRLIEERESLASDQAILAEKAALLSLATRLPTEPEVEALGEMLKKSVEAAGFKFTSLKIEVTEFGPERIPRTHSGDKPMELTEEELIATMHVSFVVSAGSKAQIAKWYVTIPDIPRLVIANRLRDTGESYHITATAYFLNDRPWPTRQEQAPDLQKELTRAGIEFPEEEIRHQDPEHFLYAAKVSMDAFAEIVDEANDLARIKASNLRERFIQSWYEKKVAAREARIFDQLLR